MIQQIDINRFNCNLSHQIIDNINQKYNLNNKIPAKILMDEIFNANIKTIQKQLIYYIIKTKYYKEFKTDRELNFYGLRWNWFNCGHHIYNCYGIVHSDYITKSNDIKFSSYVNNCKLCNHLLFCNNLSNKSYMAFNQPVEPKRFRELKAMSLTELKKQPEFNKSLYKMLRSIHKILKKGESHNEIHNG